MARILLIDDEPAERNLVSDALVSRDHSVEVNEGRIGSLPSADKLQIFDVAIVDMKLHDDEHGGLGVIRKLREASGRLLIIGLTAYGTNELNYLAMQNGADYFVQRDEEGAVNLLQEMIALAPMRRAGADGFSLAFRISLGGVASVALAGAANLWAADSSLLVGVVLLISWLIAAGVVKLRAVEVADLLKVDIVD